MEGLPEQGDETQIGAENFKLRVALRLCACLSCRQFVTNEACPFMYIRQAREVKVSERKDQAPRISTGHDLLYAVKDILGVNIITKQELVEQLKLHKQTITGTKDVLADRLLQFLETQSESGNVCPPQQPLAITFINNDSTRLDDVDSDSDEEDDGHGGNDHLVQDFFPPPANHTIE